MATFVNYKFLCSIYYDFSCCSHDLDNILLENLGDTRTLQAIFELEALVLTGKIAFLFK